MIRSISFDIFKGMKGRFGSVKFAFNPPHYYCSNRACKSKNYDSNDKLCACKEATMIQREGNVFMDITSAKADNVYDWDNKIVMALSVNDLAKIVAFLRTAQPGEELKLLHDPGAKTELAGKKQKTIHLTTPKGLEVGCMLSVYETNDLDKEANKKHTVPLTFDECLTLGTLFQAAIVKCLAW